MLRTKAAIIQISKLFIVLGPILLLGVTATIVSLTQVEVSIDFRNTTPWTLTVDSVHGYIYDKNDQLVATYSGSNLPLVVQPWQRADLNCSLSLAKPMNMFSYAPNDMFRVGYAVTGYYSNGYYRTFKLDGSVSLPYSMLKRVTIYFT